MSSSQNKIAGADRRIEQLKLQVQQQIAYIDCLQCEHYDLKRELRALDAMLADVSLMQKYQLTLYQEAAFVGKRGGA